MTIEEKAAFRELKRETYAAFHALRMESTRNPERFRALVRAQNKCILGGLTFASAISSERLKEWRGY